MQRYKLMALKAAQVTVKYFIAPLLHGIGATIKNILGLPHTIITAIADYKEEIELESRLTDALIDSEFLMRSTLGITEEESKKIKTISKEF